MYDFGAILRQLRENNGMTQAQLADRINRSKTVICKYESNTLSPTFETVRDFAMIFNVSTDYLAGIEKSETIILKGFSEEQSNLLKDTARALSDAPEKCALPLTDKQNELLGRMMSEFVQLNKKQKNHA